MRPEFPPEGFQGYRDDIPVRRYRRHLPHHRQQGATYAGTFHMSDSLPGPALEALKQRRELFDAQHPLPHNDEIVLRRAQELAALEEKWLDRGHGVCLFSDVRQREKMREIMEYFDDSTDGRSDYALGAWVIMPNHVHVLVRPYDDEVVPLEKILKRWKGRMSNEVCTSMMGLESLWFQESYDRIVRDGKHLWNCLQYIGRNGEAAGLGDDEYERWVSPEWEEQGWGFDG